MTSSIVAIVVAAVAIVVAAVAIVVAAVAIVVAAVAIVVAACDDYRRPRMILVHQKRYYPYY